MPPTATPDDIKAHQRKVEKDKITPHNLPPCPRCSVESDFFKIHAYRERRFLIVIEMLIEAVFCTLVRFACPGCGKTFTHYPDFAIPHKHYTRQSMIGFSANYLEVDDMTYRKAVMIDNEVPGYPNRDSTLAPSTIHRWITTFGVYTKTCREALCLVLQENSVSSICRDLAGLSVPKRKYKTEHRRKRLIGCRHLLMIAVIFRSVFETSIFTKLATRCTFD
jgi:hypothetical protein